MTTIRDWVNEAGGVLHKRHLVERGARDRDLTRAVREGEVKRARRGWYTTFDADDSRFIALKVGGRASGVAALRLVGAWLPRRHLPVTVAVPRNAARLRTVRGVRVVYESELATARGDLAVVDPKDALARAVLDLEFDEAVTLFDWARRSALFDDDDLRSVLAMLPADARGFAAWSDAGSESFLESMSRVRAELDGHEATTQVAVGERQFFDLEIDGVVAMEVDGREFHADSFESDRRKDLAIVSEGRIALRVSYDVIMNEWPLVAQAIDRALAMHQDGARHAPRCRRRPRLAQAPFGRAGRRWRFRSPKQPQVGAVSLGRGAPRTSRAAQRHDPPSRPAGPNHTRGSSSPAECTPGEQNSPAPAGRAQAPLHLAVRTAR